MREVTASDLSLIRCLVDNPRASYAELARSTGVSETTAKRRVEALIEDKVITLAMIPDVRRVGFQTMALIGVKADLEHLDAAADAIAAMPQVTSIHTTLGRYDMIATVACKSLEHLSQTITGEIARLPGIRDVETFVSTRSVKILRQWQLPADLTPPGQDDPAGR